MGKLEYVVIDEAADTRFKLHANELLYAMARRFSYARASRVAVRIIFTTTVIHSIESTRFFALYII